MTYEWGTLMPNGRVCEWETEERARLAHGQIPSHPVMRRIVGEWHPASDTDPMDALISDALGYLYANAPARRDEIRDLCIRYGLTVTVDDFGEVSA